MKILTAQQMGRVDRLTTERFGIPSLILMENAGFHLYSTLKDSVEDLSDCVTAILCGPGNNGGDGCVLARQMLQRDLAVEVFLLASPQRLKGDAQVNFSVLEQAGAPIRIVEDLNGWMALRERLDRFDILVDALLGTGINRPLEPHSLFGAVVADINASRAFVLAVDIPSGMRSDSLKGGDLCVQADATVTFTAPKIAHILNEDRQAVGDLHIVPIGSPPSLLDDDPAHNLNLITAEATAALKPQRRESAHKGSFGHVAVIAGSRGKSGAAALAAEAALRSGAGLVSALVPEEVQPVVASMLAEIMTEGLPCKPEGVFSRQALQAARSSLRGKSVAALGPGVGTDPETCGFVQELVASASIPLVLDADALNAYADCADQLRGGIEERPLVLTPHPGEFARLLGKTTAEVTADRVSLARSFAESRKLWLVQKSFCTLVAAPDGQVFACPLGNPGMASAGMGDVLTGVLAACLAAADRPAEAVTSAIVLGVLVHSLAGDLAVKETGAEALTAGHVIQSLGKAFASLDQYC